MILLSARDLSRQFDVEPVFRGVTFDINSGERIGLVGPNGTGKTTLMNCLCGLDSPDTGTVERPQAVTLGILEQSAEFQPDQTLIAEARRGLGHLYHLQEESHRLAELLGKAQDGTQQEKLHKRYDHVLHELDRLDAYNVDHRVDEVLQGLGFTKDDYDRPLRTFSGGQQNRLLLAKLLLQKPDLMLLDEPTNHLDIPSTEWLEGYLTRSSQGVLLVSHDRYFLDRVTNRIIELNNGRASLYTGNFSAYWLQREERKKLLDRTSEKQQEYIAKTEDFIRRNKAGQKSVQAQDRVKKLERVELVETIDDFQELPMSFGEPTRTGDWVIDAVGLGKTYGQPLFEDLTVRIHRGDRVGILGPNGSGKTTLLRCLLGEVPPDSGTVRYGAGVKIGYYDQQLAGVDPSLDAVEAIRPLDQPEVTPGMLRNLLARFGIRGELAMQQVGNMSGGETGKVALAKIAAQKVNVLILDEPTNHLDLWARSSLEKALSKFEGTLLFVSHDRYFLDRVSQQVIMLENGQWTYFEGNYTAYNEFRHSIESSAPQPKPVETPAPAKSTAKPEPESPASSKPAKKDSKRKRKFPYRKVEDLEAEIAEKEELLETLQSALGDPDVHKDHERMQDTMEAFQETQEELDTLYEHWEEAVELN